MSELYDRVGTINPAVIEAEAHGSRESVSEYWRGIIAGEFGTGLPLNNSALALTNQVVVKSGRGMLFGISGVNTAVGAQFIQIHDTNAVPANGAIPVVVISAAAGPSNFSMDWVFPGRFFQRGIVIVNSSTSATLTIGSADCWFDAQYI